jgi:uncharacterized protein YndB with AHSA1/START domain
MSSRYEPGPASAKVQKEGEKWTLVLVRDLRHPPEQVWDAITDPAQIREWAPFESDRNLGTVGAAKLTTVGTPYVSETRVKRADAHKALEFDWGGGDLRWELEPRSRSGPTSAAATSPWARRAGTSASTCSTAISPESPSGASPGPRR